MDLLDGRGEYRRDSTWWEWTLQIEAAAREVRRLVADCGDRPTDAALAPALSLLIQIERWKAMCLQGRMGLAVQNSEWAVWGAFRGALNAGSEREAVLSIMNLRGFGSSRDEDTGQRRAKLATAVLRFLMPDEWGVVDWRTAAMMQLLNLSAGNVDDALRQAGAHRAADLREAFDIIDEGGACGINGSYRAYRTTDLPRSADVEMAVFGLSLIVWPLPG
jgi:hypothetical protein